MILVPSKGRPELIKNFLKSLKETETTCEGLILIGEGDQEPYKDVPAHMPTNWGMITTKAESMGDKVREIWPKVESAKWVGILNDDHYCLTKHWDQKAEAMLDGTNMVSTNDGFWNFGFRVCGLTAWSMPLLKAAGFPIFPRSLNHYYIDDIWKNIGEATGCWLDTMKINIEHRHAFIGKSEKDATFKLVNNPERTQYDFKEFQHFMNQDFKGVCERICKLREERIQQGKFN